MDSHEIREVFLAKIYELSNPRFSLGGMQDDFQCNIISLLCIQDILPIIYSLDNAVTVDDYTSEDWKKFQAAVSVLKSPILGDSIELEPSAIGEYIHTEYIRSQSTPNISKCADAPDKMPGRSYTIPGTHFVFPSPIHDDNGTSFVFPDSMPLAVAHDRWRRKSESNATPILDPMHNLGETSGDEHLAEWVAELPESSHGRSRALTAPSRGSIQKAKVSINAEKGLQSSQTLPKGVNLNSNISPVLGNDGGDKEDPTTPAKPSSPKAKASPKKEKRRSRQQSSSTVASESLSLGPPGLVRLHMDTIQKGNH